MSDYNKFVTAINKVFDYLNKMKAGWNDQDNLNYIESIEELVKRIAKNKWKLMYDRLLDSYSVYVENIPKKICKYKEITIVIDDSGIRYFSGLC